MLPCYEWGCWPRCYEWGCWPRCCDWYWCWGLWRNSTRDSSLCYCLLFFTHQSQRKPCHKRFLITLCYRAGFFTNDEYNRANYDDNLELKPGCYPQEHHSKRGCIVPIRKQREVVLDTCPGSRVILMDLCNGVPQTKQSPNCSPKAGKVLSTGSEAHIPHCCRYSTRKQFTPANVGLLNQSCEQYLLQTAVMC